MTVSNFLSLGLQTVAWFKQAHDAGQLTLRPPFQRKPVWTDAQKSYLIDTILNEYPIPEIYMQRDVDEHGKEVHIVVDGQQRLRACLEYIEGRFALEDEKITSRLDMSFEDLSPEDKKRIFGYQFVVRSLPKVSDGVLRDIFQRLNRNVVALNPQELRHATYWGQFIRLMEQLAEHSYWEGTRVFTSNDIRRMIDVEFISELAIGFIHGEQNKKTTLDKWYKAYEIEFDKKVEVEEAFAVVLGEIGHVLPTIKDTRWRKKSDFYSLFLALAGRRAEMPFSKKHRDSLAKTLLIFGLDVELYLTAKALEKEDDMREASKAVVKYSTAVERAASDLASRRTRREIIDALIADVVPMPK